MRDMNRRCASPLLTAVALGGLALCLPACSHLPFRHKDKAPPEESPTYGGKRATGRGLVVQMQFAPDPVKLADNRTINVTFILRNVTKSLVTLKFPTTQTFEILLRNPNNGQVISQWSTEHQFTADTRLLVINPGERLEYSETITTRELKAGTPYTLEAYIVGYEKDLRVNRAIVPQP